MKKILGFIANMALADYEVNGESSISKYAKIMSGDPIHTAFRIAFNSDFDEVPESQYDSADVSEMCNKLVQAYKPIEKGYDRAKYSALFKKVYKNITKQNLDPLTSTQQYKNAIRNIGYTDLEDEKYIDELDSVLWAFNNKMISQSETFNPEDLCNRASLVAMLYRWEGNPEVTGEHPFVDVPAGTWYSDPVLWAYQNGIITGVENDTFSPTGSVNKLQLVLILYRYNEIYSKDFKLNLT